MTTAPDPELARAASVVEEVGAAAAALSAHLPPGHPATTTLGAAIARLQTTARHLSAVPARVVFGGHFSCGKSTLLNALIGLPLLPTSMLPETGVACWLSAGTEDRVTVFTDAGSRALPVERASIANEVSLLDRHQERRAHVESVDRVEIALRRLTTPPHTAWVDSPGINDNPEGQRSAARTAASADLLCWVVPSHHAFSLDEQEVVADHLASHGPSSLVFLVNVFLECDGVPEWEAFLAHPDARGIRNRIEEWLGELLPNTADEAPPVLFVSARAALRVSAAQFGLPAVRELLAEAGHGSARITESRLDTAARTLWAVRDELGRQVAAERDRVSAADVAYATACAEAAERDRRFEDDLAAAVDAAFAEALAEIDALASALTAGLDTEPLARDARHGRHLTSRLTRITTKLSERIVAEVSAHALARRLQPVNEEAAASVRELLDLGEVDVAVPNSNPDGGTMSSGVAAGAAGGALAGAAVGSALFPVLGTALGAAIGAIVAGTAGEAARESQATVRDREVGKANARAAVTAARDELAERAIEVSELLATAVRPVEVPRPPDRRALEMFEQVFERAGTVLGNRATAGAGARFHGHRTAREGAPEPGAVDSCPSP